MARMREETSRGPRSGLRPEFESLEGRTLLTSGVSFQSAFGLGASGSYPQIHSNAVAIDAAGDTFVTGSFRGSVSFDPYATSPISSGSSQDGFVAKYTPAGSLAWVKVFSGRATDLAGGGTSYATSQGSALAVDASGNVFVAGSFSGKVDFPNGAGVTEVVCPSGTEAFAAKFDASGNLGWVTASGGSVYDADAATGLAPDGSGGVVIAGTFAETATFGTFTLTAGGMSEAFAAHLDANGQFLWAVGTRGSGPSTAQVGGVAVDASGNVALAGWFSGTVSFDGGTSRVNLTSSGSVDAAVWKLDSTGHLLWARDFGGPDYDAASAVAVDGSGNLHVTGTFSGAVDFGTASNHRVLNAGPIFDAYVLKLDPGGSPTWAQGLVGPDGWAKGQAIGVDRSGGVHVAGVFSGTVDFDPGPGLDNLRSGGSTDAFAAGLDAGGNLAYALQAGRQNSNNALGLAVNATGAVAITGSYVGPIGFGSTTLPAIGPSSVYVARLAPPPPPAPSSPALEAASDTGASPSDGITSATSPVFDVITADPANLVELLRDGVLVANRQGPGAIRDPGPVADGTHAYTSLQASPLGVAGPSSAATSVTVLTKPPSAPGSAPTLPTADDSGTLGDGITSVRQPRLAGTAATGASIQIADGSGAIYGTGTTGADGSYTVRLLSSLPDGVYNLGARAVDLAGNIGATGPTIRLTIMANRPPTPPAPRLLAADNSGPSGMTITKVRQPRIAGSAQAGATVQILDGPGTVQASGTADPTGAYLLTTIRPLPDGTISLRAVATDVAGNASVPSSTLAITIDGTPPVAAGPLSLFDADDSGVAGDGMTNVRQPQVVGTAEPGSTVQVVDGSSRVYASGIAAVDGTFTLQIASAMADGSYALQARAIDLAGNVGAPGPTFTLTILTIPPAPPAAPALLAADDSGGPGLTNVNQPRLTGTVSPGFGVLIVGPTGATLGSATAGADGIYSARFNAALADGTYAVRAVAVDLAGNASPPGPAFSLTIDTTPPPVPSAPSLMAADDSGVLGDGITNLRQPRLTGSAGPGVTIRLVNPSNAALGVATASGSGVYVVAPSSPLADGTYTLRAVAVDPAGNASGASVSFALVILATPPPKPAAPSMLAVDDIGVVGDGITEVRRPRIVGTVAPYARVDSIGPDGAVIASTTASATGAYQFQAGSALPTGSYTARVRVTDVAGNAGAASDPFNYTIRSVAGDYFGEGKSDYATYAKASNTFYIGRPSGAPPFVYALGSPGDVPVSADFFGLGRTDVAIYRPSTSTFYAFDAVTGAFAIMQVGRSGDVPVPADYDGDGKADFAVFRPSDGTFYILKSTTNTVISQGFAIPGDVPVPGDYFGTGHAALGIYRPGTSRFYAYDLATRGYQEVTVGSPGDTPVPADYEGVGRAEFATYSPFRNVFSVINPWTSAVATKAWGVSGDIPVTGDYFGDGRAVVAVFHPANSWFFAVELAGTNYAAIPIGQPGLVRPIQAPITTWFQFGIGAGGGGVGTPLAARSFGGPSSSAPAIPLLTGEETTAATRKAKSSSSTILVNPPAGG